MKVSVIIPVFNEENNVETLFVRLKAALQGFDADAIEYLFVNDGSSDNTLACIKLLSEKNSGIKFIDLSRNFGHQVAVTAGLDHCSGDMVVIIDADLQDPPELIPELLNRMKDGYDVVYAKRRMRKGEGFMKKVTAKFFYRLLDRITTVKIPLDTGDFRAVSRRVVEGLRQMPEKEKFIRGQIAWMGFEQTFVEYDRDERSSGSSGYTWRRMIRFALDGITSFSDLPLKLATILGFLVSFIAFILMLYALYSRLVLKVYEPGWTSLMLSVLFIGGIQLIAVGIIGEYIGRISNNVRQRPLYLIKDNNLKKD